MANASQKGVGDTRILHCRDGLAVAQVGRLCAVVWRHGVTPLKFEQQRAALAEVVRTQPEGIGFLCVVEPGTKPPDDTLRRASMDMVASHGGHIKCVGIVIEGQGFWVAMTRSVFIGMSMLLPMKTPATGFSNVPTALRWMRDYVPVGMIDAAVTFIEDLRRQLDRTSQT